MTKEDYKLLLNECCNRIPYGVWVDLNGMRGKLNEIKTHHFFHDTNSVQDIKAYTDFFQDNEPIEICNFKLCLRPISDLTEKECDKIFEIIKVEKSQNYVKINDVMDIKIFSPEGIYVEDLQKLFDFLNSRHIDYNGLIPKGIAIDSTDLDIYGNLEE